MNKPNLDSLWSRFSSNPKEVPPLPGQRELHMTSGIHTAETLSLHEGYSINACHDPRCDSSEITIAVSSERLIDLFHILTPKVGRVVIPSFYKPEDDGTTREYEGTLMNTRVFLQQLDEYRDTLRHDVYSMLQICDLRGNILLDISPEKLMTVHALPKALGAFQTAIERFGIHQRQNMKTILDCEFASISDPALVLKRDDLIAELQLQPVANEEEEDVS
jgi:hypothetical protein